MPCKIAEIWAMIPHAQFTDLLMFISPNKWNVWARVTRLMMSIP